MFLSSTSHVSWRWAAIDTSWGQLQRWLKRAGQCLQVRIYLLGPAEPWQLLPPPSALVLNWQRREFIPTSGWIASAHFWDGLHPPEGSSSDVKIGSSHASKQAGWMGSTDLQYCQVDAVGLGQPHGSMCDPLKHCQFSDSYSEKKNRYFGGEVAHIVYGQALSHPSLAAASFLGFSFILGKEQGHDQEKEEAKPNPPSCILFEPLS